MKKITKKILRSLITGILNMEARFVLWRYRPKIVVVTGTVGKTSTKDAVFAVFDTLFTTRKSDKSFNSEIGVPLTILGLPNAWGSLSGWMKNILRGFVCMLSSPKYPEWLIIEMGTDRPGDMSSISKWLHPDIVVATRFAEIPVHVENFKSPEDVIKEEQSIAYALSQEGVLVANNDDPISVSLRDALHVQGVSFGMTEKAGVNATHLEILYKKVGEQTFPDGVRFRANHKEASVPITIQGALGVQHVYPVIAALATGISQGINLVKLGQVFDSYETPRGRMRLLEGKYESLLIDDSYNSSPVAAEQALITLKNIETKGRRIVVFGDMKELGVYAEKEHVRIGKIAGEYADMFIVVGEHCSYFLKGAEVSGLKNSQMSAHKDAESAGIFLQDKIQAGDIVLIKGSQSIRLEKIVEKLMLHPEYAKNLLVRQEDEWNKR